jgi:hypothetical protein
LAGLSRRGVAAMLHAAKLMLFMVGCMGGFFFLSFYLGTHPRRRKPNRSMKASHHFDMTFLHRLRRLMKQRYYGWGWKGMEEWRSEERFRWRSNTDVPFILPFCYAGSTTKPVWSSGSRLLRTLAALSSTTYIVLCRY